MKLGGQNQALECNHDLLTGARQVSIKPLSALSSNVSISFSMVENWSFDIQSVNSEWIQPGAAGHRNLFRNEIKILAWPDMRPSWGS